VLLCSEAEIGNTKAKRMLKKIDKREDKSKKVGDYAVLQTCAVL
jgi:hypothetical protein